METWTPTPLSLSPPFIYSDNAISEISQTEEFDKGIDVRDQDACIVCGLGYLLEHTHIVPKVEVERWEYLRGKSYIPFRSKSVRHEARNGILLCKNHHGAFESLFFYIRWEPAPRRFIFINHSRTAGLEPFHGRAVRLFPGDSRTPFFGAFIDHEMRVRGRFPYPDFADRPNVLPLRWQEWISPPIDEGGGGNVGKTGSGRGGDLSATLFQPQYGAQINRTDGSSRSKRMQTQPVTAIDDGDEGTSDKKATITFKNPMTNPDELERIMRDAPQQASWKAAMIEGESWNGTANENMEKYQKLFTTC